MTTQMLLIEAMMAGLKGGSAVECDAGSTSNARGGVHLASLSQYSGGVYDKPRLLLRPGRRIRQAGPEAIMPPRGSDGSLGVDASGGGVT
jgi:phage-related minor tail protein